MHLSVYLPFLFSGLFGSGAPMLARRLPPAVGTWLLSIGGLLAAAGPAISLALLGFTLVGQSPLLAERGHWSPTALRHADPVADPVAVLALVVLAALTLRFLAAALRRLYALREAYRLAGVLPAAGGELAVVDHPDHQAYAAPGRPGRIVVSRGLLLPAGVALTTERWADECAAATCRRDTVADALTHAATGGAGILAVPAAAMAATATQLTTRLQALRNPAPRLTLWRVALLLALVSATAATVAEAAHDTERLFELAQAAYRAGHH